MGRRTWRPRRTVTLSHLDFLREEIDGVRQTAMEDDEMGDEEGDEGEEEEVNGAATLWMMIGQKVDSILSGTLRIFPSLLPSLHLVMVPFRAVSDRNTSQFLKANYQCM